MHRILLLIPAWVGLLLILNARVTADEDSGNRSSQWSDVQRVAAEVDAILQKSWRENDVTPAPAAGDAEYLRRLSLDLVGKIPRVATTRAFLQDESKDKKQKLVDELLDSPAWIVNFTDFWQAALIPETESDQQLRFFQPCFEAWIRDQLREGVAYDEFARRLLSAPLRTQMQRDPRASEAAPDIYFRVKELKPENLAASTARAFLGVRIECAQCHHHPHDVWKQEQFWSFAAFFSGFRVQGDRPIPIAAVSENRKQRRISIPDTETVVEAAFLTNDKPDWSEDRSPRETLADWVTSPENPWFARMAANRLWGHFFGRGIVDPVDDFGVGNEPSHPEILDLLAREFVAHEFDTHFLIRVLVSTRAYQLSSEQTHESQEPPELFARMQVRGLTPRQVFNSLAVAMGTFAPFTVPGQFQDRPAEGQFLETFRNDSDSSQERQTTILQALSLMNGQLVTDGTSLESSRTLRAVIDYPLMSTGEKIETLYLAALVRKPRKKELIRLKHYVGEANPYGDDKAKALTDIYWSLLNSSEFLFNH